MFFFSNIPVNGIQTWICFQLELFSGELCVGEGQGEGVGEGRGVLDLGELVSRKRFSIFSVNSVNVKDLGFLRIRLRNLWTFFKEFVLPSFGGDLVV